MLIKLSNHPRLVTIDEVDADIVMAHKWRALTSKNHGIVYAITGSKGPRKILMHRLLMSPESRRVVVDHINHDGLDNRRSNLRLCTHAENIRNSRRHMETACGLKGVTLCNSGRYRARIAVAGQLRHLGVFDTPEAAQACYARAAREVFGEFACNG